MTKFLLPLLSFFSLSAVAQWDSVSTTIDTVQSAGGSFQVSDGWSFSSAEEYDASDFIQAKVDQFYVSVERKPDSLAQVNWRLVQQRLRPGELFVDFLLTEFNDKECFLTSIIRPSGLPEVVIIPRLQESGKSVKQANARGIDVGNAQAAGSYMAYKNLLAHLEPKLDGAQTIYYSTSNDLNLANLKFLKGTDGHFLFEKYNLVRLHSAASFLGRHNRLQFPKKMKVLLLGNVAYDCGSETEHYWDALPGSG
ncbi:MAG: hypothetical protein EOO16_20745, partial [Chitinophagaceae bacterium]